MRKYLFGAFLLFASNELFAQGLKELLAKAQNNDLYQSQLAYETKAKFQKESALKGYLPTIEAAGVYLDKAKTTQYDPKSSGYIELKASYTIFDGLKRESEFFVQKTSHEAQKFKSEFVKQQIMLNIVKEYYAHQNAAIGMEAYAFKLKELDENIKKLNVLTKNGLSTKDRLEAMTASRKEAEFELENLKLQKQNSLFLLELLTNSKVLVDGDSKLNEPTDGAIKRKDLEADRLARDGLKYASLRYSYLPTLSVEKSIKRHSFSSYDDMGGAQKLPAITNDFGLRLSFPLFDFGKISKDKEAATAEVLAVSKEITYKENSAKTQKELAFLSLESAKIKLESAKSALVATNTAYEYTKKRFEANLAGYTEFLMELTKKQEAIYRSNSMQNDVEIKKAEAAFALGVDLLTLIKE